MGCSDPPPFSVLSRRQPATSVVYADARYLDAVIVSQAIAAEALLNGPSNEGCAAAAPLSANAVTESGNATDTNATVQIERRWTSDLEDCSPLERTEIICWIASFIFSAIAVIAIMAPVVPWLVAKPFKRSLSERLRTHGNAWNFAMW